MSERDEFEAYMFSTGMAWDNSRELDIDGDEQYADIETRVNFGVWQAARASQAVPALTDEQIIALADRGEHLTTSPSKYPECGHGTQYHCGAPGLLGFARAILAARAMPVPKGWKLVPERPTVAMCVRGAVGTDGHINGHAAAQVYAFMLDAAPQPKGEGE